MIEIRRALADLDRPPALAHQRFAAHRQELDGLGVAERFIRIHEINLWGSEKSVSGLGSEPAATAIVRAKLAGLLRRLGAKSLLDAPCGDAGWMRGVDLGGIAYFGVDVVPSLIAQLQHRNEPVGSYICADIITDRLPRCDVVLCRDCLVHLSFDHAAMAVAKFRASGARWLIATTFIDLAVNYDCEDGDWRPLNMMRAPFGWPAPRHLIVELCREGGGGWRDKSLGVWDLTLLP